MKEDAPAPTERPLRTPEEYRAMLDPNGELPKVVLRETGGTEATPGTRTFIIGNDKGGAVGNLILKVDEAAKKANVTYISVFNWETNQKYGKAAYLELVVYLAGLGLRLDSRHSMNPSIHAVWTWLTEKNAARLVEDRGVHPGKGQNLNYSTSLYEVI